MICEIDKFNLIDCNSFLEYTEPLVISEQIYRLIPKNKVSYILSIPYYHIGIDNKSGKLILQPIKILR